MELTQRPDLRQKVTLSPQVYQGLSILAMPVADLRQLIEAEMLENPTLETEDVEPEIEESQEEREEGDVEDDRAWEEWLEMYEDLDASEPAAPRDPNAEDVNTEEFVGGTQTFDEYLIGQIGMLDLTDGVARAARTIVGSLDNDGFFVGSLEEIAALADVSAEEANMALQVVQQLDPPGVGAIDLADALCLQLAHLEITEPLLETIVREHLSDIGANHYRKVARILKTDEAEVRRVVAVMRTLNPRPAGAFSPGPSPGYIIPDVTLRRFGEEWTIMANNDAVPALRVSPRYRSMLRANSKTDEETRKYLKERIRSAESFIHNVDRRTDTVSRIAGIILEVQAEFFEDGTGPLRPLRLEDVAVEIGVHLSTVSRGVTGKYMDTPYGLFELKHFFSGGYRTSTGFDVAATTIKQRLKRFIEEEGPDKPLSDQKIAELLSKEGVKVARRTVAKYREELAIEPSWARRRR